MTQAAAATMHKVSGTLGVIHGPSEGKGGWLGLEVVYHCVPNSWLLLKRMCNCEPWLRFGFEPQVATSCVVSNCWSLQLCAWHVAYSAFDSSAGASLQPCQAPLNTT